MKAVQNFQIILYLTAVLLAFLFDLYFSAHGFGKLPTKLKTLFF